MFSAIKNYIKKIVGEMTLPSSAVKYYDCMYIPSKPYSYPRDSRFIDLWITDTKHDHPFNYRQIKQNWYGKWVEVDCWLGLNSKIIN